MNPKYVNPYTDFGFKKIFGEEASKPLLIDFLNTLLPDNNKVKDLSFKNTEQLGQTIVDRKAIYDIYCENDKGEKFIVELQKAKQNYFKDRTVYYSTFPIREQAEKGEWDYKLNAVYCIGILDFCFENPTSRINDDEVIHFVNLKDQHGRLFYDKLTYIYLEMPNFNLHENELKTRQEKWLYFIKNLEKTESIPEIFSDEIFSQAFECAKLSALKGNEILAYENSLKVYRDLKGIVDTAYGDGKVEGKIEGKIEIVKNMLVGGLPIAMIAQFTELTESEIFKIQKIQKGQM